MMKWKNFLNVSIILTLSLPPFYIFEIIIFFCIDDCEPKSELELELWNELNRLKEKLLKANQKLEMYATEKTRFIETMRRNVKVFSNLMFMLHFQNCCEKNLKISQLLIVCTQ